VNDNLKMLRLNYSGLGCWLTLALVIFLLGSVGLGWIFKGFLAIIIILTIVPIIGFLGVNWWLKRNLVEDKCPVCSYEFTGFNGVESRCPNCGEQIEVKNGHFNRTTPPGTIDIEATEIRE
jgi:hypothetical protein